MMELIINVLAVVMVAGLTSLFSVVVLFAGEVVETVVGKDGIAKWSYAVTCVVASMYVGEKAGIGAMSVACFWLFALAFLSFIVIKEIKSDIQFACSMIEEEIWRREYFKHAALDGTLVKVEIDAVEEVALLDAIFEDAIKEERKLTDVEVSMVREIISNNNRRIQSKTLAMKHLDSVVAYTGTDFIKYEINSAHNWIKCHLTAEYIK